MTAEVFYANVIFEQKNRKHDPSFLKVTYMIKMRIIKNGQTHPSTLHT